MTTIASSPSPLAPVRFVHREPLLIAGFGDRFTADTTSAINALWQEFVPFFGKIPNQVGRERYGVSCHPDRSGGFEYIAGVCVDTVDDIAPSLRWVALQAQYYAVFEHLGHLSGLGQTYSAIWQQWLPGSGYVAADAPEFECYHGDYDDDSDNAVLEIWIPLSR